MHRHGYQGRKLHRDSAQRKALLRGLSISLIEHGTIETTLPRAKELVPFIEPLITKAKKGDLASRRAVISALNNRDATHTLVDELVGQMGSRVSGHVRIKRTRMRVGDNAQLATVSFVDTLVRTGKPDDTPVAAARKKTVAAKATTAKPVAKTAVKKAPAKKPVVKKEAK
jgi:large subunit ribosomal protein L17